MYAKRSVGMDAVGSVVCVVRTPGNVGGVGGPDLGGGEFTSEDRKKKKNDMKKALKKAEKKKAKKL